MLTADQKAAFDLLGVSPTDDPKKIQSAWRALVRTYHPDQYRGDKAGANARLAELNAAYDAVEACHQFDARAAYAQAAAQRAAAERNEAIRRRAEAARKAEAARRAQAAQRARDAAKAREAAARRATRAHVAPRPDRSAAERRLIEDACKAFQAMQILLRTDQQNEGTAAFRYA